MLNERTATMKLLAPTLLLTLTAMAVPAVSHAACTGNRLNQTQLAAVLSGNTVCGRPGPGYPGGASDRWQEQHRAAGQLWDFKLGTNTMDPTKQVGSWAISGQGANATIVHTYPSGGSAVFNWRVYGPNTNVPGTSVYAFCTDTAAPVEHVTAHVRTGQVGCTSFP